VKNKTHYIITNIPNYTKGFINKDFGAIWCFGVLVAKKNFRKEPEV